MAGAALIIVASFCGSSEAATQRGFFDPSEIGNVRRQAGYLPEVGRTIRKKPVKSAAKKTGKKEVAKSSPEIPKGTLQLVVSIAQQHVTLYSNGVRVGQAPVSTGVPGHPTPMGVFSVIQKDRYHHSNIYSGAPMPFMQRITWSGVAIHEGPLPGHPASHGCIRTTHEFAARLWVTTKLGVRIIVARNDVAPYEFSHAKLFNPREKPAATSVSEAAPMDGVNGDRIVVAQATTPAEKASETDATPRLRGQVEPAGNSEPEKSGSDATEPQKPVPPKAKTAEPVKRSGQVAVFVSKREKKIFVRQGMIPLFDMPVEIANPEQPLGTHVFTAMEFQDGGARMRWNAISLPGEQPRAQSSARDRDRRSGKRSEPVPRPAAESRPASSAAEALDRVTMPQEAIDRISEILTPGSSLVVSDYGLGGETGQYTDFIVLTR
jgi:hypothetical protein